MYKKYLLQSEREVQQGGVKKEFKKWRKKKTPWGIKKKVFPKIQHPFWQKQKN